jgi:predicted metal-dependent HD superfamily phosphohydrolase
MGTTSKRVFMVEQTTRVSIPEPWPLPHRTDLRDRLVSAYSTGRGYHNLLHLTEVLERITELGEADNTDVVLAAWFHDAVYDDAGDNEERSAQLAESELGNAEVARLVRLTRHHRPDPGDHNGEVLCDADLAVLAAGPERYTEYTAGVRLEYAAYDDDMFAVGRAAVLTDLLARPTLFHTAYAREHWEARARANMEAELQGLSG